VQKLINRQIGEKGCMLSDQGDWIPGRIVSKLVRRLFVVDRL